MSYDRLLIVALGVQVAACAGADPASSATGEAPPAPGCTADADCAGTPETPLCEVGSGACMPLPPGHQLGWKDGAPGSVSLVTIYEPDKQRDPQDLQFNPSNPDELWVINRKDDSVIVIERPGMPDVSWKRYHDPDASHFMHLPPALDFGAVSADWGQTFGVCGDNDDGGDDFMGPALFSAELDVFAKATPGGLGSHLDMLHSTTFCRGIVHLEDNAYFVFNSAERSLDKYDFRADHGPGNEDHSDGDIYRYVKGTVAGVDGVPSHLAYDAAALEVYVADTGNHRIAKLDASSGTIGKSFPGMEDIAERRYVDDAVIVDAVPAGTLQEPSGVELHDRLIFVSDHATSRFYAFDMQGTLVRQLDTGLAPGSLAGFTFGPKDDKVYFVDRLSGRVYRIDPLF